MSGGSPDNHPLIHREFKSIGKSPNSFKVLQYNILADALSLSTPTENFCKVPPSCLEWSFRSHQLLKQILSYQADILCLEEVDHFTDYFQPELSTHRYTGSFTPKKDSPCLRNQNNTGPDGVAIFYRSNRFVLKESVEQYLTDEDGREGKNPILVHVLEDVGTKSLIVIGVTHLKAKSDFSLRRNAQAECAIGILKSIAVKYENAAIIFAGDFNGEPNEPFYQSLLKENFCSAFLQVAGKEPEFTTWKIRPSGEVKHTIDYIWQHDVNAYNVAGVLDVMQEDSVPAERFPSFGQPSDHIPLCFEFCKD